MVEQVENLQFAWRQSLQQRDGPRRAGTTKRTSNAGKQLARVERLGEIVIGTNKQAGDSVGGFGPLGGNENDRNAATEPIEKHLAQFETTGFEVEHDQRRLGTLDCVEGAVRISGSVNGVPEASEERNQANACSVIGVDDEY
jgi:hypothetical protein